MLPLEDSATMKFQHFDERAPFMPWWHGRTSAGSDSCTQDHTLRKFEVFYEQEPLSQKSIRAKLPSAHSLWHFQQMTRSLHHK